MTTPPPTGNNTAPEWLPDEATLSRMAGEFFRALPGQPTAAETGPVLDGPVLDGPVLDGPVPAPAPAFDGRPEGSAWPTPTGLPAADPPAPAPTAGMSPPSGPPPTSAAAGYAASAPTIAGHAPELPALPVTPAAPAVPSLPAPSSAPVSAPAQPSGSGSGSGLYYFLNEAPATPRRPRSSPVSGTWGCRPTSRPSHRRPPPRRSTSPRNLEGPPHPTPWPGCRSTRTPGSTCRPSAGTSRSCPSWSTAVR
ncbi:hypothetical protein [Streptacidiphilus sp. PAMC 29251]